MQTIHSNVIKEIGHQIEPELNCMDSAQMEVFSEMVAKASKTELSAIRIATLSKIADTLLSMAAKETSDNDKYNDLMDRYDTLMVEIKNS